ncbi:hypothetical protein BV898_15646 [Hypsibius exemplaris]|uniref:Mariner Mos1 transposase n=1 Tax=Hypsibius exemplaris TaxID=2072580 RepID=A0A9X6NBI9_HYPEX|nr:hypothetical protein BV898_15646 [Hypsibius exemplaris]
MARRVGVSEATIRRLADGRLEKKKLKKVKVHYLTAAAILQRSLRASPFYDLIKDGQFMWVFSMDEAMLPLDYENGQSEYYYDSKNVEERRKNVPVFTKSPSHPQQRMYAAGFGWEGQSRLYVVEPKAKVNAAYFIEKILSPMMLVDVPKLYSKREAKNVILHMDSARSHTAKPVYEWL